MKIITETKKNLYGKKAGYIAKFEQWEERGNTKEEAKENLQIS